MPVFDAAIHAHIAGETARAAIITAVIAIPLACAGVRALWRTCKR